MGGGERHDLGPFLALDEASWPHEQGKGLGWNLGDNEAPTTNGKRDIFRLHANDLGRFGLCSYVVVDSNILDHTKFPIHLKD